MKHWATVRLSKPHNQVVVYLDEQIGSLWHPVIELHDNCLGMTHETCVILKRIVFAQGYANQDDAMRALADFVKKQSRN